MAYNICLVIVVHVQYISSILRQDPLASVLDNDHFASPSRTIPSNLMQKSNIVMDVLSDDILAYLVSILEGDSCKRDVRHLGMTCARLYRIVLAHSSIYEDVKLHDSKSIVSLCRKRYAACGKETTVRSMGCAVGRISLSDISTIPSSHLRIQRMSLLVREGEIFNMESFGPKIDVLDICIVSEELDEVTSNISRVFRNCGITHVRVNYIGSGVLDVSRIMFLGARKLSLLGGSMKFCSESASVKEVTALELDPMWKEDITLRMPDIFPSLRVLMVRSSTFICRKVRKVHEFPLPPSLNHLVWDGPLSQSQSFPFDGMHTFATSVDVALSKSSDKVRRLIVRLAPPNLRQWNELEILLGARFPNASLGMHVNYNILDEEWSRLTSTMEMSTLDLANSP